MERIPCSVMHEEKDKVLLMYGAVIDMISDGKDAMAITVSDITSRAGIGKGTAYEYFSSKDEIIVNAMLYGFKKGTEAIIEEISRQGAFKDKIYFIFEWFKMHESASFIKVLRCVDGSDALCAMMKEKFDRGELREISEYAGEQAAIFMQSGYNEGIITEKDSNKRVTAFFMMLIEYVMASGSIQSNEIFSVGIDDEAAKDFAYASMIKALN